MPLRERYLYIQLNRNLLLYNLRRSCICINDIIKTTTALFICLQAFEELEDLLAKNNICIAVKERLVKDSGVADDTAYDNIVLKLLTKPRARGE